MSHIATDASPGSSRTIFPLAGATLTANFLLGSGLVLILGTAAGALWHPQEAAFAWLFGFLYFFTIVGGSLFWSVVHHAVHAAWTTLFRRLWENVAALFPVLAFLFLPLFFCGPTLYQWMQPDIQANDPALHEKANYLCPWFFYVRAILFFLVFISIALFYRRHSVSQDRDGSPVHSAILQERSYVLLALFGLSITYASFDWIMSLDFHWASTMFGVTIFAGAATSSAALIILLTLGLQKAGYLKMVHVEHYHLLGKVLFSFVTFWAWVSFAQYLFIWYANIPEETVFFIDRSKGTWAQMAYAMMIFNFAIPFLILLFQATKRSPFFLALTAGSVLLGHGIELYWLVMPTLHPAGVTLHWLDVVTWVGMALILASYFIRYSATDAIYPVRDPRLPEATDTYN
jgi:hypothetical protein